MAWKLKKDPQAPAEPAFHHPERCMNCGHVGQHEEGIGCLVEGGTKYIENEEGEGRHACSCTEFVPAPTTVEEKEPVAEQEEESEEDDK